MKLYELSWGLYPRRVGIYLAEKGITSIERVSFDLMAGWPPPELTQLSPLGTVPILQTEEGTLIRSSVAILEYLEERFPSPNMLGTTPEYRARTREFVGVIDEAAMQFGIWCHKGSPAFAGREPQSSEAATFAADAYYGRLRLLEKLAGETKGPFLTGADVTIADCIGMATLQFAKALYDVSLPGDCPILARWYVMFAARPSAALVPYPAPLLAIAQGLTQVCPPSDRSITERL
ncbi:glutathione S-transferase family protein [Sphingomonas sp. UYEF23]|uniref:glutathione S-transferase family protein n=1 Tax=Sphingomonas sp. UYEF23 TaxID=1756408 RepID=UPI00339A1A16